MVSVAGIPAMEHGGLGDDHNGCDGVLLNQLMDLRCSCLLRGPLAKRTRLPVMEHLLFNSSRTAPGQLPDSSKTDAMLLLCVRAEQGRSLACVNPKRDTEKLTPRGLR